MNAEIEELYQTIAESVDRSLPEEWSNATVTAKIITGLSEMAGTYRRTPSSKPQSFSVDFAVLDALTRLREIMAEEQRGKGAWNTAVFEMDASGKFKLDFDYGDADFTYAPTPEQIAEDRKRFPRS